MSADALQVYAGLETSRAWRARRSRRDWSIDWCRSCRWTRRSARGSTRSSRTREIDELLAADSRPIVVGGTGLYLRAALTELSLRPPPPEGVRERWTAELERHGAPALHARLRERASWAAAGDRPERPPAGGAGA